MLGCSVGHQVQAFIASQRLGGSCTSTLGGLQGSWGHVIQKVSSRQEGLLGRSKVCSTRCVQTSGEHANAVGAGMAAGRLLM